MTASYSHMALVKLTEYTHNSEAVDLTANSQKSRNPCDLQPIIINLLDFTCN